MPSVELNTILQSCTVFYESLPHLKADNTELLQSSVELVEFLSRQYSCDKVKQYKKKYEQAVASSDKELLKHAMIWFQQINIQMAREFAKSKAENGSDAQITALYFEYLLKLQVCFSEVYVTIFVCIQNYHYLLPQLCFDVHMMFLKSNPEIFKTMIEGYVYSEKDEQVEITHCPVCGAKGEPYFTVLSYKLAGYSKKSLPFKLWMHCGDCENLYSRFMAKFLLDMSEESELIHPHTGPEHRRHPNTALFHLWCNILNKIIKINGANDILEVGTGNGSFLAIALEMGLSVEAVELDRQSAQDTANLLGIDIMSVDFLKFEPKKQYDAIFMGDVIEHMTAPKVALKKVHDMLKDDGVLWLSTPNYESAFSRFTKFEDPMWCEFSHITYFSYKTLSKLLNDEGFEVLEYTVSNRYNGSMELIIQKTAKK